MQNKIIKVVDSKIIKSETKEIFQINENIFAFLRTIEINTIDMLSDVNVHSDKDYLFGFVDKNDIKNIGYIDSDLFLNRKNNDVSIDSILDKSDIVFIDEPTKKILNSSISRRDLDLYKIYDSGHSTFEKIVAGTININNLYYNRFFENIFVSLSGTVLATPIKFKITRDRKIKDEVYNLKDLVSHLVSIGCIFPTEFKPRRLGADLSFYYKPDQEQMNYIVDIINVEKKEKNIENIKNIIIREDILGIEIYKKDFIKKYSL